MTLSACIPPHISQRRLCGERIQHQRKAWHSMACSTRECTRDPHRLLEACCMDCGRKSPARTAHSLDGVAPVFFHAPAACCGARRIVLSINRSWALCISSGGKLSPTLFQRPRAAHRLKRFYTASHWPQSVGRSLQGMPVRIRYTIASRHRRSLCSGGLPALCLLSVTTGSSTFQTASVRSNLSLFLILSSHNVVLGTRITRDSMIR